jgi:hypothetical protein
MSHRIPEFIIDQERDPDTRCGVFFIRDAETGHRIFNHVYSSVKAAQEDVDKLIREELDNYDGPDVPGWEGGFAENH